jgi:hypothetical protein
LIAFFRSGNYRLAKMKMILIVLCVLVPTVASANGLTEMGESERCAFWTQHAMYGASQSMRGASREVEFISRSTLRARLLRPETGGDRKLYILNEEGYTDVERAFVERSALFGYDEMSIWKSRNGRTSPRADLWHQRFMAMCLERPAI